MRNLFAGIVGTLSLAWRLFLRTIGAKYRKSFLGYFWMVVPALLVTGGVTLAQGAGVINGGSTALPYPLFVLIGTLIWYVFAEAFDVPHQAFQGARSYLTRVYFPREAIILAQLLESLITAAVRLVFVLLLVAVFCGGSWRAMSWITACFAGTALLGLGLGAIITPLTLLFEDLHHTLKLALSYGLFLTPAMYQPEPGTTFARVVHIMPVSSLMDAAREAAVGQAIGDPTAVAAVITAAVVTSVAGFVILRATSSIVIERMLLGGK
jgi:lipopolysaccharide transport system permease protein